MQFSIRLACSRLQDSDVGRSSKLRPEQHAGSYHHPLPQITHILFLQNLFSLPESLAQLGDNWLCFAPAELEHIIEISSDYTVPQCIGFLLVLVMFYL